MEGFTIVDGVVVVVIVLSALLAYSRGLVRECLAIGGWVLAGILAYMFVGQVQPLVKEVPVIGEFLGDNCILSLIAAFAAIMTVGLVVISLFNPFFASLVQRSVLGGLDQALGFLFGVARGIVLVAVSFFVYEVAITGQDIPVIDDSRSAAVFMQFTDKIEDQNPEEAVSWIKVQYESLVGTCDAPV